MIIFAKMAKTTTDDGYTFADTYITESPRILRAFVNPMSPWF
jgi:hypothetical protein